MLQEFINKYNGKKVDWDGAYGAQCVDLIRFYLKDFGIPQVKPGNAVTWWNNASTNDFEKIANSPNNFPQAGDIVIWNGNIAGGAGLAYTEKTNKEIAELKAEIEKLKESSKPDATTDALTKLVEFIKGIWKK